MSLGLFRYSLSLDIFLLCGSQLGAIFLWAEQPCSCFTDISNSGLAPWFSPQLPRLYNVYKEMGIVDNFETILVNVFAPLFEVTVDPSSHPDLHVLLTLVSELRGTLFIVHSSLN